MAKSKSLRPSQRGTLLLALSASDLSLNARTCNPSFWRFAMRSRRRTVPIANVSLEAGVAKPEWVALAKNRLGGHTSEASNSRAGA